MKELRQELREHMKSNNLYKTREKFEKKYNFSFTENLKYMTYFPKGQGSKLLFSVKLDDAPVKETSEIV